MKLSEFIDQDIAANFGQVRLPVYSAPLPAWPVYPGTTQSPGVPPPPPARTTQSPGVPPPPPRSVTEQQQQQQQAAAAPVSVIASTAALPSAGVKPGDRNSAVTAVQAKFNSLIGFREPLVVDGIFGPKTEAAVRALNALLPGAPQGAALSFDFLKAFLAVPAGAAFTAAGLAPYFRDALAREAAQASGGTSSTSGGTSSTTSTAIVPTGQATSDTAPDAPGFDLTVWVKGNWQWFLIGAIGLVTLGLFLTGPKDALAGVKEVESLDLDDLDLGNPLPPPRKRKARRSKRKARR